MAVINRIAVAYRYWKIRRHEEKKARVKSGLDSIALGFAWQAKNIGGVRRHLECIKKYSSHHIDLYPSTYACKKIQNGKERYNYHLAIGNQLRKNHSLFHTHVDPAFIRLAKQAQQKGKRWLHTYHALYISEDWGNKLEPWQVNINNCLLNEARHADICISVGTWLVDWLKEEHNIESRFLPNGVDIEACDNARPDRFIQKYGFSDFVLFVGSIEHIKNPLLFIDAARNMPEQSFIMVGTGLTKEKIENTFGDDYPKNLIPLGPLPHDQVLDAMAACKTFVMTSFREGQPTVLLEAMSMKKACVVPDAPWVSDAIQSDIHGLKYETSSRDDLVEKIAIAMEAEPFTAARMHVEETFSWPVIIRQLDQIYKELLD